MVDTTKALDAAGIPVIALDRHGGQPVDAVMVVTVKWATGLDFTQILLVRVEPALLA